ncbi:CheR family methyltransferase [Glaciecola siphonariae]|uniref:Chemotaxis protein methyltransferase n=1 Tax=Glaciecola siphonariae TaxID=521012 RepID=A0ABV9LQY2_9ALTE
MTASTRESTEFGYKRADFEIVRAKLKQLAGINLADSKDSMVYSRLSRRIRTLHLGDFKSYLSYLDGHKDEQEEFINALTTNLTSFFRERHHFDHLLNVIQQAKRPLKIWCAASSTGEEPYSIAMTAVEALGSFDIPVSIIASDIDSKVLQTASNGVYKLDQLASMENSVKKRFFHRGKGANAGNVKVVPELRNLLSFQKVNLMDSSYQLPKDFDIVFCRNVMIYFDKPTQLKILEKIITHMRPDGYYYAGHSENFSHVSSILKPLGKTVYQPKERRG